MVNIKSENQTGGITGQNVHVDVHSLQSEPKSKLRSGLLLISGAAAIVTILTYFGWKPLGAEPMKDTSKNSTVNVTSYNQQGGITAQNVIVNQNLPESKLSAVTIESNVPTSNKFHTRAQIELLTPFPVANLYLKVFGKTLESLEVNPMRAGMFQTGHSGKREGYSFTNIPNASGKYEIQLTSTAPEQFSLDYEIK